MKQLIAFLSVLLCAPAYAENFTANDKVLFFSTDVLIEVIERNFDKNLQLDVANKYIELMDSATHSVSIADLTTICATGQIDIAKCRNFINDLFTTMDIGDTVRPFYWADYIPYRGDEPSNTFVPHMGFEQDTGIWTIRFPWMKEQSFRKQYPGVEHLGGISACTGESGTVHVADMSKNFSQNEQTGNNCWCKMTYPEESAWVYNKSGDTMAGGCERSCALECLDAIRGADESMRAAMFTAVKLNGSNEHGTIDPKKIKDEFKPCEFDWGKYADSYRELSIGYHLKPIVNDFYYYDNGDTDGLNYDEWGATFNFMESEDFKCKYPNVKKIKGIAKFERTEPWRAPPVYVNGIATDSGVLYIGYCYCKMIYPEKSKWVKLVNAPLDDVGDTSESIVRDESDLVFYTADQSCIKYCYWYGYTHWGDMFKSIGKK